MKGVSVENVLSEDGVSYMKNLFLEKKKELQEEGIWRRHTNWENISSESMIIKRIIRYDGEWILFIYIFFFQFLKILKSAQSVKA